MKITFWNYDLFHLNNSIFSIELYDLSLTLDELLTKIRYRIINDNSRIINFLKVRKSNPKEFINNNDKYWNLKLKFIDYIDFYQLNNSNNIDIIYKLSSLN